MKTQEYIGFGLVNMTLQILQIGDPCENHEVQSDATTGLEPVLRLSELDDVDVQKAALDNFHLLQPDLPSLCNSGEK